MTLPPGLYAILDPDQCGGREPLAYARALIEAGASILQLRDKNYRAGRALELASALAPMCAEAGVLFVVNDRIDVALLSGAPAVHLGPDDIPLELAAERLGPGVLLGRSTNQLEEAVAAAEAGADYVAFGPMFPTDSKTHSRMRDRRSLEDLKAICQAVRCPVYAIGGITAANAPEIAAAGAAGIAVIGALAASKDLRATCAALSAPWR
ncbi:MAG: thiamine phosphate synthase [Chrysiogenetes bacterium]|nr:thiamine phosphate synthase [Chrysiogenetes bacterium]